MNSFDKEQVNLKSLTNCYNGIKLKKEVIDVIDLQDFWKVIKEFINNKEQTDLFQVKKEIISAAPETPMSISRYITYDLLNPYKIPQLIIENNDVTLDKYNQIVALYDRWYLEWENWSEKSKKIELLANLYNKLLNMFNLIKDRTENYKIAFTDSIMVWNFDGQEVFHPNIKSILRLERNLKNKSMDIFHVDEEDKIESENLQVNGDPVVYKCPLIIAIKADFKDKHLLSHNQVTSEADNIALKEGVTFDFMKEWITNNEDRVGWIKDYVSFEDNCPITDEEFVNLMNFYKNIGEAEVKKVEEFTNIEGTIPALGELEDRIEKSNYLKERNKEFLDLFLELDAKSSNLDKVDINIIDKYLEFVKKAYSKESYNLSKEILTNTVAKDIAEEFERNLKHSLSRLIELTKTLSFVNVEMPEEIDINNTKEDLQTLEDQLRTKGKIGLLFKLTNPRIKNILNRCKVDGEPVDNLQRVKILKDFIEKLEKEQQVLNLRNNFGKEFKLSHIEKMDVSSIGKIKEELEVIALNIKFDFNEIKSLYIRLYGRVIEEDLFNIDKIIYTKRFILALDELRELKKINEDLKKVKELFSAYEFTKEVSVLIDYGNIESIRKFYLVFNDLRNSKKTLVNMEHLDKKLNASLPLLWEQLKNDANLEEYKEFEQAFKWARWSSLVKSIPEELLTNEEKIYDEISEAEIVEDCSTVNDKVESTTSIEVNVQSLTKSMSPFEDNARIDDFSELIGDLIHELRDSNYTDVENKNDFEDGKENYNTLAREGEIQNFSLDHIQNCEDEKTVKESVDENSEVNKFKKDISDRMYKLTSAQKKVAEFIIDNIDEVGKIGTAINFGKAVGVSSSTVLMALMRLQLGSYTKFKETLEKILPR